MTKNMQAAVALSRSAVFVRGSLESAFYIADKENENDT